MKASTHSTIVKAGCGCGALVVGIALVSGIVVYVTDPDSFKREFAGPSTFTPYSARAALDSLLTLDFGVLRYAPRRDAFTLPGRGAVNGAEVAVRIWTQASEGTPIAFGDTFPEGDRQRQRWLAAADWHGVDSLRAAALLPWDLAAAAPVDSNMGFSAAEVLSTVRALLARARVAEVRGDSAEADTLARAAVAIGRHLRTDARFYHVYLGARVEVEGLSMLAGAAEARVAAESVSAVAGRAYRWMIAAAAFAGNSEDLVEYARKPSVPLPVRRAALLAVGSGWAFAVGESEDMGAVREHALAAFLEKDPPAALRHTAEEARRLATLSLLPRITVAPAVQRAWTAWRRAG